MGASKAGRRATWVFLCALVGLSCETALGIDEKGWLERCQHNSDCRSGLVCAATPSYEPVFFCAAECQADFDCEARYGIAAFCYLDMGVCGRNCLTDEECPGDALCRQDWACTVPPEDYYDAVCGNTIQEGWEQCDHEDLAGATCADLNSAGTGLSCNADCTYNRSTCISCGDGVRTFGEDCDCGTNANFLPDYCTDINGGPDANCSTDCLSIPYCGDGFPSYDEECDCGMSPDFMPTGCPDINGGPNANCDENCLDISLPD